MTAPLEEAKLRHWLVDYLVTTIGCSPEDVDVDAPLNTLGVGSRDAVVMSGELSELVRRPVSPVEFWAHPTIAGLARFLAGAESDPAGDGGADRSELDAAEPIAVIGLGCRFPGGIEGPEAFWQFLRDERSAVGMVPPDRWQPFHDGSAEVAAALSRTTRWGAFLSDIDAFDAEYFDISPSEADKMDPQQRLLLEVAHEALEHAGIPVASLRHSHTGVFAGACVGEYGYLATADLSQVDAWSGTGGALSIIANRVSYFFDLRGPSITVDTACSSSLVAIHLACQSLRSGDIGLALAAGVNLMLSPAITRSFDRADAMSPTGACHAFDASADGFVRGEGCGVVLLKRLSDAQRDGDRVLAVVRGSAVNQDGRSNGLMAPNPAAQMAVLRAAYAGAGIEARDVDYVEAHGTGTLLGDPIEARALGTVLGRGRPASEPLLIGAVKSNLGHLEAAAGVAGFIKAVLAVQRGQIPANRGFVNPNPHIPFDNLRLRVVAAHTEWPEVKRARRAGVSSFGFGGTNAHVVIEEAPPSTRIVRPEPPSACAEPVVTTLAVSGKSAQRVGSLAGVLADWLEGEGAGVPLAEVAHTLDHHRGRFAKFATVVAADHGQAVAGLRAVADGRPAQGVVGVHRGVCRPGTVFVYSGQGSQWAGMGRQLLAQEPAFAAAIDELERDFASRVGFSLRGVLESGESLEGIDRIQPVLVGVQLALTALWRSYGVHPDAVIGHSMGEVAAAVVAGALSPADGLTVIAQRSRLLARLSGRGAMALLELDAGSVAELVSGFPGVAVAVYASPRQTVVAGPAEQVDAVVAVVAGRERLARRIEVDVASHHRIVDPILPELRSALAGLCPRVPSIPLISTAVAGGVAPAMDADYWCANLREPVRFSQAVSAAGAEFGTFVEVSPHPVLTYAIDDTLGHLHHHSIATLQRDTGDTVTFHTNLNATHTVHPPAAEHGSEPHPTLPTTPWHRTRHWIRSRDRLATGAAAPRAGTLLGERIGVATTPSMSLWRSKLTLDAKPYPGSHRLVGLDVVPVSVLLHTLSTAAAECGVAGLSDIVLDHPIVLDQPRIVQVVADGDLLTVSSSLEADAPAPRWVRHCSARLCSSLLRDTDDACAEEGRGTRISEAGSVAELRQRWGVQGQPFEWTVDLMRPTAAGAVALVDVPDATTVALVDAAVHLARLAEATDERLMVPAGVESARLTSAMSGRAGSVRVRRRESGGGELIVDIVAKGSDGTACADIRGLRYVDVESGPAPSPGDPRSLVHEIAWRPWAQGGHRGDPGTLAVCGIGPGAQRLRNGLMTLGYRPAELSEAGSVVYVAESDPAESDIDASVRMGSEVSDLVRRLAGRDLRAPGRLWIITRGVREPVSAGALTQSCLWGIAAVVAAEQPDLWGGLVDLPCGGDIDLHLPALAGLLPTPARTVLALRNGELLCPEVVPAAGEPVRQPLCCRPDAAYLVTGGLGALGLLIADWLADRGARRLVLAGRTGLPPRRDWHGQTADIAARHRIDAVRALEHRGVAVDVVALDIGSTADLRALLERRDCDGAPPIRGVVHAAGVTENNLLTDLDNGSLHRVMWPKIAGAQALHHAFPVGDLDFFYLTASAGTVFGVPGQGSYAAANAYLDCLARSRHLRGCHALSLDWVAWRGLGFGADAAVVVGELDRLGSRPINPDEAFAAWEYADQLDIAQAVMAPMPGRGAGSRTAGAAAAPASQPASAWAEMASEEMRQTLIGGLRQILAHELRIAEAELEVDRPFAELGLNSVMAMSIRRDAEQLVGIELSATMLWNHPTIASLAEHLAEKLSLEFGIACPDIGDGAAQDGADSVLSSLFDSVESAGVESGI